MSVSLMEILLLLLWQKDDHAYIRRTILSKFQESIQIISWMLRVVEIHIDQDSSTDSLKDGISPNHVNWGVLLVE